MLKTTSLIDNLISVYFGGTQPNMVDVWMYGNLNVCRDETLFAEVIEAHCPKTMKWFNEMTLVLVQRDKMTPLNT
jgi:hypothetical protein